LYIASVSRRAIYRTWFWEEAPFFRVLPPLVIAIICYDKAWIAAGTIPLYVLTCFCLFFFVRVSLVRNMNPAVQWLRFLLLQLLVFGTGLLCCRLSDVMERPDWLGHHIDGTAAYTARVLQEPAEKPRTYKLTVAVTGMLRDGRLQPLSGKAFVYVYKNSTPLHYSTGDEILLPGRWQPIAGQRNPFAFDYRKYAARNGFHFQQFLPAGAIRRFHEGTPADEGIISHVHNRCMRQLEHYITDAGTRGILQAMILGDDVHLDPDLRQAYADTGIIHVVAISGGHVVMFFVMISALFFWLKHKRYLWVKYAVALPFVWFYVLVAGAPPSAVRAAVMFSVLAFGISLRKEHHALNQLCATAFLLLCAEPWWLFSLGFQLSFIAVLSLILFYRPLYRLWPQTGRVAKALWEAACASIAAELLVAPLVVYYFHLFPVMFLPANIIAWLLMGIVLVLGTLLLLVTWLPAAAGLLSLVLTLLVSQFHVLIYRLQALNPDAFRHLMLSFPVLIVLYAVIGCFAAFFLRKYRPALWSGMAAVCLLLVLLCVEEWQALRQHRIVVFHTGGGVRVERIAGKYYHVLVPGDTLTPAEENMLRTAHTGWHAWRSSRGVFPVAAKEIFHVHQKNILRLHAPWAYSRPAPFPVHALLVDMPLQEVSFEEIYKAMQPETVVICGIQRSTAIQQWRDSCAKRAVAFHVLKTDGAFIIQ